MKIGLVGSLENSGHGISTRNFQTNLPIYRLISIVRPTRKLRRDWVDKNTIVIPIQEIKRLNPAQLLDLVKGLDILLARETPSRWDLFRIAKKNNIKTINSVMWERPSCPNWPGTVDLLIAPVRCCYSFLRKSGYKNVVYIPVRADTEYFKFKKRKECKLFGHFGTYLSPKQNTKLVMQAFSEADVNAALLVNFQTKPPNELLEIAQKSKNKIIFNIRNIDDRRERYKDIDVLIQPSLWEGLGWPIVEAMAQGIPVITVDAPPMNEFVNDKRFLAKSTIYPQPSRKQARGMSIACPVAETDKEDLKSKIEYWAKQDLSEASEWARNRIEDNFSWKANKAKLLQVLEDLVKGKVTRISVTLPYEIPNLWKSNFVTPDDLEEMPPEHYPFKIRDERMKELISDMVVKPPVIKLPEEPKIVRPALKPIRRRVIALRSTIGAKVGARLMAAKDKETTEFMAAKDKEADKMMAAKV